MRDTSSDPDVRAQAIERGLAAALTADNDVALSDTFVLPRLDKAECRAFLVSLCPQPTRLVVPLRSGLNVVARGGALGDHEEWPRMWCEAAQCHILCTPSERAFVGDRSTFGTMLWPAAAPFDIRVFEPPANQTGLYTHTTEASEIASWSAAPEMWTPLAHGDVLLCLRGPWVFAWMPQSSSLTLATRQNEEVTELHSESRVIESVARGDILVVTFHGVHEWAHGREMDRVFKDAVAGRRVAAILFNLLEYEYVGGNDVDCLVYGGGGPGGEPGNRIRPVCIVASGRTRSSLHGFFRDSQILDVFRIDFADTVEDGLLRVRTRIAERDGPRLPANISRPVQASRAKARSVPEPGGGGSQMRDRIFVAVGVAWGGSFIASHFPQGLSEIALMLQVSWRFCSSRSARTISSESRPQPSYTVVVSDHRALSHPPGEPLFSSANLNGFAVNTHPAIHVAGFRV